MAKLPKERATLSFMAVAHGDNAVVSAPSTPSFGSAQEPLRDHATTEIRITSDKLRLPNYMCGYYGCSQYGLVLVTLPDENNTRLPKPPFRPQSGDLLSVKIKTPDSLPKDEKSGALIVKL